MRVLRKLAVSLLLLVPDNLRRRTYGLICTLTMGLASFVSRRRRKDANSPIRIAIFDRRLTGNLRAFVERMQQMGAPIEFGFLSLDLDREQIDHKRLPKWVRPLDGFRLRDMCWAIQADVFLTSIRANRFRRLVQAFNPHVKFVQVFHSISLTADPPVWFEHMGRFDALFCSSEWMGREVFATRNIETGRIRPTGFACLDELAAPPKTRDEICRQLGLDPDRKVILIAPTLSTAEMAAGHVPITNPEFLQRLNGWAASHDVQIVIRAHPHERPSVTDLPDQSHLLHRPALKYPKAIEQLLATDILVSDASGIAVYFLGLGRPIVFWNAELPNDRNATFLSATDLPGPNVDTAESLLAALTEVLCDPASHQARYGALLAAARERAFGDTLDGHAAERYYEEICRLLGLSASLPAGGNSHSGTAGKKAA